MVPSLEPQVKSGRSIVAAAALFLGFAQPHPVVAESYTPSERARFEAVFLTARTNRLARTNDPALGPEFARAAFDWADAQSADKDRARIAQEGIDACRQVLAGNPASAPAHYFLALNLGQLAQTKTVGALRIVPRIEAAFASARACDENFDHAGPDRGLGLLYLQAPGWPTSVGSKAKARKHLLRAVELAPTYPGNRLALAEAHLEWREKDDARRQLAAVDRDWPANRRLFPDSTHAADWRVWLERRNAVAARLGMPRVNLDTDSSPTPP